MGLNWQQLLLVLPYTHIALAMEAGAPATDETAAILRDELYFLRTHFQHPKIEGSVSYAHVEALQRLLLSDKDVPILKYFNQYGLPVLYEAIVYDLRLAE